LLESLFNTKGKNDLALIYSAISDFELSSKFGVDDFKYYNATGSAYNSLGEFQKAISYYSKAIQCREGDADLYSNRGAVYVKSDRYEEALKDLNEAIKIDSECYGAYHNRGCVYMNLLKDEKDIRKALDYVQKAYEDFYKASFIDPEHPETIEYLEDSKKAIKDIENKIKVQQTLNDFGYADADVNEKNINIVISKIDERIGDLELESGNYEAALYQFVIAFARMSISQINNRQFDLDENIIRIIDKILTIPLEKIDKNSERISGISKELELVGAYAVSFYTDNKKEIAESIFRFLMWFDHTDCIINLAYMKRRRETKHTHETVIQLLDKANNENSALCRINRALCYITGIDVEESWELAINELQQITNDLNKAKDWWSDKSIVGEKESAIVDLLIKIIEFPDEYTKSNEEFKKKIEELKKLDDNDNKPESNKWIESALIALDDNSNYEKSSEELSERMKEPNPPKSEQNPSEDFPINDENPQKTLNPNDETPKT
jgi:tetratricopeptide (TPR) repeat protein